MDRCGEERFGINGFCGGLLRLRLSCFTSGVGGRSLGNLAGFVGGVLRF